MWLRVLFLLFASAMIALGLEQSFFPPSAWAQSSAGLSVKVEGDVSSVAAGSGAASTRIGSTTSGKGTSTTNVMGNVTNYSTHGSSVTEIGTQDRGGTTVIRGDATNVNSELRVNGNSFIGGNVTVTNGSRADIGGCGSVYVSGDVVVPNGNLEVGCGCAGRRNGQCCIEFHQGFCVLQIVPPSEDGCPPGFILSSGLCRLFSDFEHKFGK
ncbi:hypothetical protein [Magnetospirillum molischianum]|uniref:Uncharacterized protein n=1 Tax=Magnetospirillum molischianum DSM 120 TaxID=1150626 RepID=H8FS46_MAGML|nr:hypothetical protein [Magnetospirillum molischianum]CCG41184.1 conserved exported hypothetical protein [Magnetospirillum molischianum DSM 120]